MRKKLFVLLAIVLIACPAVSMHSREEPNRKKRTIRACTFCRIYKKKCDGLLSCQSCKIANSTCVYPIPLKRGRKPKQKSNQVTTTTKIGDFEGMPHYITTVNFGTSQQLETMTNNPETNDLTNKRNYKKFKHNIKNNDSRPQRITSKPLMQNTCIDGVEENYETNNQAYNNKHQYIASAPFKTQIIFTNSDEYQNYETIKQTSHRTNQCKTSEPLIPQSFIDCEENQDYETQGQAYNSDEDDNSCEALNRGKIIIQGKELSIGTYKSKREPGWFGIPSLKGYNGIDQENANANGWIKFLINDFFPSETDKKTNFEKFFCPNEFDKDDPTRKNE